MKSMTLLEKGFGAFEILEYEKWNDAYEGRLIQQIDPAIKIRSRLAKKTPKKEGYFVAFWKKKNGIQMSLLLTKIRQKF